ncbi:MAG: 23S rRNA (uridine(2552)-2'-O)-methyltransferase RlmE [Gammaproteobacteria bacterium]
MARSKSSGSWLKEHFSDPYVKKAQEEGWRSRAAYKLAEIDRKDGLLKAGMRIVDLGAAPGGWSQYAAQKLQGRGQVVALDILPMDALLDVTVLQADFRETEALDQLRQVLSDEPVDLVLSDMAPNMSGQDSTDQARAMYLAELALEFVDEVLRPGGAFLTKVFQGVGFDEYLRAMRERFERVASRKPDASRARSREIYLLGQGFRG